MTFEDGGPLSQAEEEPADPWGPRASCEAEAGQGAGTGGQAPSLALVALHTTSCLIYNKDPSVAIPPPVTSKTELGRLLSLCGLLSQLAMAFGTGLIPTSNL